jgi:two-component system nitrogen regulation response regulator NtrX
MQRRPTILIVEDNHNFRELVKEYLLDENYHVLSAENGEQTRAILQSDAAIDLLLLDLRLPDVDGMQILDEVLIGRPNTAVIVISAHGNIATAVEAVKKGAYDFLQKPISPERLLLTVQRALDFLDTKREKETLLEDMKNKYRLIGVSPVMKRILSIIDRVARTKTTVLITGESGTGKELVARAIHLNSDRAALQFVEVNCAAIPENLIESELFGHMRGAFTGALRSRRGKFQLANGGTLFLDEIGDLSLPAQAKVLRAIENGEVTPVGGDKTENVDVRLIAATNKNLQALVEQGEFRPDLFHRINVISIHIPPLRERPEDILPLADYFLEHFANQYNRVKPRLAEDAKSVLLSHDWPGNVRELRNVMEKAVVLFDRTDLHGHDIYQLLHGDGLISKPDPTEFLKYHEAKEKFERIFLLMHLRRHNWNITQTAKAIGLERSYLYKLMEKLGIRRENEGRAKNIRSNHSAPSDPMT